jgi:hypothetical protein
LALKYILVISLVGGFLVISVIAWFAILHQRKKDGYYYKARVIPMG